MRTLIYLGVLTIVLALTEGSGMSSMMSGYGTPKKMMMKMMMQQKKVEAQPDDRCKKVGQYLTIPGEQCKFMVCDYGSEPWKDSYGNIKLFTVEMPCAPGTFVQDESTNGYGITNPCGGRHDKMCLPQKKSGGYGMMSMKKKTSSNTMKMKRMMMKKKSEMRSMGYEETMTMMKELGKMLQNNMYSVMTMSPKQKMEVEKITEKAEQTGYGEMQEDEMKHMCVMMMKMMVKMEEMKERDSGYGSSPMKMEEQTGYGSTPMVMVMPMEMGYGKQPEHMKMEMEQPMGYGKQPEPMKMEMPMGYGMQPMMKMKQIMTMMKRVMKMMKEPEMMSSGYGQMPEPEPEPQQTGYEMMEAKPMPSYRKMEEMMEEMVEKMEAMSGYGEMEERQGYGKMEMPEEMPSGYGKMEEMQKPMMVVMVPQKEMSKTYWD